jgi:hypothetical protein
MSIHNSALGCASHIHGELLKLGFAVAQSTVGKYMAETHERLQSTVVPRKRTQQHTYALTVPHFERVIHFSIFSCILAQKLLECQLKGTPRQQNLISLLLRIMAIASRSWRKLRMIRHRPKAFESLRGDQNGTQFRHLGTGTEITAHPLRRYAHLYRRSYLQRGN